MVIPNLSHSLPLFFCLRKFERVWKEKPSRSTALDLEVDGSGVGPAQVDAVERLAQFGLQLAPQLHRLRPLDLAALDRLHERLPVLQKKKQAKDQCSVLENFTLVATLNENG